MPFGLTPLAVKALAGLALLAAILLGIGLWDAHQQALGESKAEAKQAAQALAAEQEARRETERRVTAIQENADHADQAASAARADADAARAADQRLRLRLAAAERRGAPADSAASDPGAPADSPTAVPYDVFSRVDDAAGQLGDYADQLRISLDACIGSYRALTPGKP